jgi:hypothetical protein
MTIRAVYRLPSEPFGEWLKRRTSEYESIEAFANEIGSDFYWMRKVINGKVKVVNIDKVDQVLCSDGTTHLREIYPELYEE